VVRKVVVAVERLGRESTKKKQCKEMSFALCSGSVLKQFDIA